MVQLFCQHVLVCKDILGSKHRILLQFRYLCIQYICIPLCGCKKFPTHESFAPVPIMAFITTGFLRESGWGFCILMFEVSLNKKIWVLLRLCGIKGIVLSLGVQEAVGLHSNFLLKACLIHPDSWLNICINSGQAVSWVDLGRADLDLVQAP